jgi:hypothetical protein
MHWCTIYSEFWHPRISSYQNKIARRTDQLWEFSNELGGQDPNLWAQQVRRRQSDHYLKDVWSWKSSVERKWQHLHWLSKPHIWGSGDALQIGSNWSWWLRISVHKAQLLCFGGSTGIYACICRNYTTSQHLAAAPSSNSSYCSLPA